MRLAPAHATQSGLAKPTQHQHAYRNTEHCSQSTDRCCKSRAGDGTRTRNLLITNQLLCQLSYAGISVLARSHAILADGSVGSRTSVLSRHSAARRVSTESLWFQLARRGEKCLSAPHCDGQCHPSPNTKSQHGTCVTRRLFLVNSASTSYLYRVCRPAPWRPPQHAIHSSAQHIGQALLTIGTAS
jgi:hypothetical protein